MGDSRDPQGYQYGVCEDPRLKGPYKAPMVSALDSPVWT